MTKESKLKVHLLAFSVFERSTIVLLWQEQKKTHLSCACTELYLIEIYPLKRLICNEVSTSYSGKEKVVQEIDQN